MHKFLRLILGISTYSRSVKAFWLKSLRSASSDNSEQNGRKVFSWDLLNVLQNATLGMVGLSVNLVAVICSNVNEEGYLCKAIVNDLAIFHLQVLQPY